MAKPDRREKRTPGVAKLLAYLAGALILAVLVARLPLPGLLPGEEDAGRPGEPEPGPLLATSRPAERRTAASPTSDDPKVAAARREGKLVWWHSLDQEVGQRVLAAFHARYQEIDVQDHLALPVAALYPRLLGELRAGTAGLDVLTLTEGELAYDLQQRGFWGSYLCPQQAAIPPELKSQPAGLWAVSDADPIGVAWNGKVLAGGDAPTDYQDLLLPRWKEKLGLTDASSAQFAQWYALNAMLGPGFWDQLARNQPVLYPSSERVVARLASGHLSVAVHAPWSVVGRYLRQGYDLRLLAPPDGLAVQVSVTGLSAAAPRPNAAKVFIDFLFSAEGQALFGPSLQGTYSTRPGVAGPSHLPGPGSFRLLPPALSAESVRASKVFPLTWARLMQGGSR